MESKMSGKNTDWHFQKLRDEILERMGCYKTPEDEYLDEEIIEDFEDLIRGGK